MNDIKFNCPQCGQHLTVPSSGANTTVACPNCGQAIAVPSLARAVATAENPKQTLWPWLAAAGAVLLLVVISVLIWQFSRYPSGPNNSASAKTTKGAKAHQSPDAQVKQKWSKALNAALDNLEDDGDTAALVSDILGSLDQPGGLTPEALAADRDRINHKVLELVRSDSIESASTLQVALYATPNPRPPNGPANPNHKTGGQPGPGGLVLYLPLDKPADADGTVHDESGVGNDGKVFGAQWVSNGKFGGAFQFHITNLTDRIVIPNSDTLNPDYITIAAWVKTMDEDGFWNRIADKDYHNYCFDLGGGSQERGMRGRPGLESSRGIFYNSHPLNDNRWHHIAVTYDGKTIACYIDGNEQSHAVRRPGPLKKSDWDLCIGNSVVDYGTGEFLAYDGLMDEVRIYNRALSAAEIQSLATATNAEANVMSATAQSGTTADTAARPSK